MVTDWKRVNKKNPCPVCGKIKWCRTKESGAAVECMGVHAEQVGNWHRHYTGNNKAGAERSIYRKEPPLQKAPRKAAYRDWEYKTLDGKPALKTCRKDYDDGRAKEIWQNSYRNKKWVNKGAPEGVRENLALYRHEEIKQAIANGELIFVCEGEPTADALVSVGMQATTNFGGSGAFYESDWKQLEGANVVLCPDADSSGVAFMEKISKLLPNAQWCYIYPNSYIWQNLSKGGGLDFVDYLSDKNPTFSEVLELVVTAPKAVKSLVPQEDGKPETPKEEGNILDTFQEIIDQCLEGADLTAALKLARTQHNLQVTEAKELYQELVKEATTSQDLEESREEFQALLNAQNTKLDLREIFPTDLAGAMIAKARSLNVDPNRFVIPLLAACGKMIGGKNSIYIRRDLDKINGWRQYAVIYGADVIGASSQKSATLDTFLNPIRELQSEETKKFNDAIDEYETLKEKWSFMGKEEKRDLIETSENPRIYKKEHCKLKVHLLEESTTEALFQRLSEQEECQGVINVHDELAGLFSSMNQYSNGKGNAQQLLLSLWNGRTYKSFNRKTLESSYSASGQTFSLYGGIQPDVIKGVINTDTDPDGLASRFLFCVGEKLKRKWSYEQVSISGRLSWLYNTLDKLPIFDCDYTSDAQELFVRRFYQIGEMIETCEDNNPGMVSYLGKQDNMVARISLILHLIECAHDQDKDVYKITKDTLERAIVLDNFFIGQFKLLQIHTTTRSDRSLDKMILTAAKALKKKGKLTVKSFSSTYNKRDYSYQGQRINHKTTRKIFGELERMGLGVVDCDTITAAAQPPSPPAAPTPPPAPQPPSTPPSNGNGNGNGNGHKPTSIKDFQVVATPANTKTSATSNTNNKVSGKVTPAPKERELPTATQVKVEKEVTNQGWTKKYTGVIGLGYVRYRGRLYEVLNPQAGENVDTYPARLNLADPKDPGNIHKRRDVSRWDCESFKYLTDEESEKKAQVKKDKEAIAAKQRAVNSVIPEEQSPWKDKFHGTYKLTSVYTDGFIYDVVEVVFDPDKETFPEELVVKPCAIKNRTLSVKIADCKSFYYPHRNFNQEGKADES